MTVGKLFESEEMGKLATTLVRASVKLVDVAYWVIGRRR